MTTGWVTHLSPCHFLEVAALCSKCEGGVGRGGEMSRVCGGGWLLNTKANSIM